MEQTMENISGHRRKQHFANGGTVGMWRGRAKRIKDQKKEANKKACRKSLDYG
jgi:hypothetical protein